MRKRRRILCMIMAFAIAASPLLAGNLQSENISVVQAKAKAKKTVYRVDAAKIALNGNRLTVSGNYRRMAKSMKKANQAKSLGKLTRIFTVNPDCRYMLYDETAGNYGIPTACFVDHINVTHMRLYIYVKKGKAYKVINHP